MKNSPRHSTANGYAPRWQRPGADTRPTLTTDEVRASLKARYERLRDASR